MKNKKIIVSVSFIVIAHNEEFSLKKSLKSISKLSTKDCETIVVDSGSEDKTLDVAKSFTNKISNYKIISIKGYQNSGIARNEGIYKATKKYIFFVDGDVELDSSFIYSSIECIESEQAEATIGILEEYQYSSDYSEVLRKIKNRTSLFKEEYRYYCGGIFFTTKAVVNDIGIFDTTFIRAQDFDYSLRITKKYRLKAMPVNMGIHHTVPYGNKVRLKNEFTRGMPIFYGKVIRKNISNYKGCLTLVWKNRYLHSLLIIAISVFCLPFGLGLFFIGTVILLDMLVGVYKKQDVTHRLMAHFIVPFLVLYGIVFNSKIVSTNEKPTISEIV